MLGSQIILVVVRDTSLAFSKVTLIAQAISRFCFMFISNGPQKLDSVISALPGYAANLATG